MNKLTRLMLWCYVFTVSWDTISLPLVGSASRAVGLAAIGTAMVTTMMKGRIRRPGSVFLTASLFALWCTLSLLWTVAPEYTLPRSMTYIQLVVSVWMFAEFVRTKEERESLLFAFCLGAFVPMVDLLINFKSNEHIVAGASRFTGSGLNADTLGSIMAIGLPISWYLILHRQSIARVMPTLYFVVAPLALLLTGTRGAFVAGLVALLIVPLTLPRQSLRTYVLVSVLLVSATVSLVAVVPAENWERVLDTQQELSEGRMSGRREIWRAGWAVLPEHPILGVGAGAYAAAVEPTLRKAQTAHSVGMAVLVETGVVGALIFVALLGACAWTILRSPPAERSLSGVLMVTWLVAAMSSNLEYVKITWFLFGMVAAQSHIVRTVAPALAVARTGRTVAA